MKKIIIATILIVQVSALAYGQQVPDRRTAHQEGEYALVEGVLEGQSTMFRINTKTGDAEVLRRAKSEGLKNHGNSLFFCWERIVNPENVYDNAVYLTGEKKQVGEK